MADVHAAEELAFAYCIRSLAAVARSERDMRERLVGRGYEPAVIDAVIARLLRLRYLDDAAYADTWARSRVRTKGLAGSAVRRELRAKGIADELIDDALSQIDADTERQRARELVERKMPAVIPTDRRERDRLKQRLGGVLARKGYSGSTVWLIVDEVLSDAPR